MQQLLLEDSYTKWHKMHPCRTQAGAKNRRERRGNIKKKKHLGLKTYERTRWREEEEEECGEDYVTAGLNVSASVAMLPFNHA